jgi:hypothetical protein
MRPRVYVDLNSTWTDGRVFVPPDSVQDWFASGVLVTLHYQEVEADGTLELEGQFEDGRRRWMVRPDWSTQRDIPVSGADPDQP